MNAANRLPLILLLWLGLVPFVSAQPTPFRHELLDLLPDDFAVCVVVHDLRGHSARWEKSAWLKAFRASPLGKSVLESPEMAQFNHWQAEMKKHLDLDWPTLRDDILGDTLIMSYTPGPKNKPDDERGLFLLHVRNPERLIQFIDKLNDIQKKSGEVKLTEIRYKDNVYHHRREASKSQYYFVKDSLAVVSTREEVLQAFLERRAEPKNGPWAKRFAKAGVSSAFFTMCVNSRMLDAEIGQKNRDNPLPKYWKALEAIFVSASIHDDVELRITIQADSKQLPDWAQAAFTHTAPTSSLWQRFPEQSILTIATQTDFTGATDAFKMILPAADRKKFDALLKLEQLKEVLPNIGPDWGVCVLPSKSADVLPQAMFALAVKPGAKDEAADQTLLKAIELFVGFAVLDHNQKNPSEALGIETVMQGNVRVRYLTSAKLFPPRFQPACALKDGFLIVATSPAAIMSFRLRDKKADERKDCPLLRISAQEFAQLLEHRRKHILGSLAEQNMPPAQARKNLENVIGLLGLFDHLTVSQQGDSGQATWTIRLTPLTKPR